MKSIFRKLLIACSFLSLAILAGITLAHLPNLTPSVDTTWRCHVSTVASRVEFHGGLPSMSQLSWSFFALTAPGWHIKKTALLNNLVVALLIGGAVATVLSPSAGLYAVAGIFTLGTVLPILAGPPKQSIKNMGIAMFGVAEEVWANDIAEELFPENDFMWKAKDDNAYLKGITVHLPQSGGSRRVVKNRSQFPATVVDRQDTVDTYNIDEYTTDPVRLSISEEETLSYDKRKSVIEQDLETLKTDTAANLLYAWGVKIATSKNSVRSTGANRQPYLATQTGTRKTIQFSDFMQLHMLLDYMKVPRNGRVALIDPGCNNDLLQIEQITNSLYIGQNDSVKTGNIGNAIGFEFIIRSEANRYSNDANPVLNAVGAVPQGSDNLSIMAWHPLFVRRAWGSLATGGMRVFENPERPEYYGDVISMMVRCGGAQARQDGAGIVTLIEGQ